MRAPSGLLIVGQAPSRTSDPELPFSRAGRSGRRLQELGGVTDEELRALAVVINLWQAWPGTSGHGDLVPEAWDSGPVLEALGRAQRVVLVGREVAVRLLGEAARRAPYLAWSRGEWTVAILPHPSGVNRWWNEPRNVRAARRFLRAAFRWARG